MELLAQLLSVESYDLDSCLFVGIDGAATSHGKRF